MKMIGTSAKETYEAKVDKLIRSKKKDLRKVVDRVKSAWDDFYNMLHDKKTEPLNITGTENKLSTIETDLDEQMGEMKANALARQGTLAEFVQNETDAAKQKIKEGTRQAKEVTDDIRKQATKFPCQN